MERLQPAPKHVRVLLDASRRKRSRFASFAAVGLLSCSPVLPYGTGAPRSKHYYHQTVINNDSRVSTTAPSEARRWTCASISDTVKRFHFTTPLEPSRCPGHACIVWSIRQKPRNVRSIDGNSHTRPTRRQAARHIQGLHTGPFKSTARKKQ